MNDDELARRAEELRQETQALSTLLAGYATNAEVIALLGAEKANTKTLLQERDRWRNALLTGIVVFVLLVALFVWRVSVVANDDHHTACRFVDKHNLLVDKVEEGARAAVPTNLTPEQQQAADAFVKAYVGTIEVARVQGC